MKITLSEYDVAEQVFAVEGSRRFLLKNALGEESIEGFLISKPLIIIKASLM